MIVSLFDYYLSALGASAQLVAATPAQQDPNAKRSRAEKEAALAEMSAKKVKTTTKTLDGKTAKTAHDMDVYHLNNGLQSALDAKTKELLGYMENLKPSPDSKTNKKIEDATRQISLMLAEIKQMSDMNEGGAFDGELRNRREALKSLFARRSALEKSLLQSHDEIVLD